MTEIVRRRKLHRRLLNVLGERERVTLRGEAGQLDLIVEKSRDPSGLHDHLTLRREAGQPDVLTTRNGRRKP